MEPNVNLLGRLATTPDERDFTVEMVANASSLELAYMHLQAANRAHPAVKSDPGRAKAVARKGPARVRSAAL